MFEGTVNMGLHRLFVIGFAGGLFALSGMVQAGSPPPQIIRIQSDLQRQGATWTGRLLLLPGTTRFSLAVELAEPAARSLRIVLLDSRSQPLSTASEASAPGEFRLAGRGAGVHLSPRFIAPPTGSVTVQVLGAEQGLRAPVRILSAITDVQYSNTQAYVDDGSIELCDEKLAQRAVARSVARLSIRTRRGSVGYCTGFAVTPNHLLTNHHCVEEALSQGNACEAIDIEFNFVCASQRIGIIQPTCQRVLPRRSNSLDYAVIEFRSTMGAVPPLAPARIGAASQPYVLHHSAGMSMRMGKTSKPIAPIDMSEKRRLEISDARADCSGSVRRVDDQFSEASDAERRMVLTHAVNTTGGASGAPVLVGNNVVALHFDRDRRYYPVGGACFDAGVENCMTRRLQLPNWSLAICDVLEDIAPMIPELRKCAR